MKTLIPALACTLFLVDVVLRFNNSIETAQINKEKKKVAMYQFEKFKLITVIHTNRNKITALTSKKEILERKKEVLESKKEVLEKCNAMLELERQALNDIVLSLPHDQLKKNWRVR